MAPPARLLLLLALLCGRARCAGGLVVHVKKTASRLAIVLPFTQRDSGYLLDSVRGWAAEGDACPQIRALDARRYLDFVFWFNRELLAPQVEAFANDFTLQARAALSPLSQRACFRHAKFLSAGLSDAEDRYPAGPSNQFYALLLNQVGGFSGRYDYFFLMEQDVRPLRAGWLDALWLECAGPGEFFIKGSVLRGRRADANLQAARGSAEWLHVAEWLPHINGNALYRLGSEEFTSLVAATRRAFDPNGGWKPFDTSLWAALVSAYMRPEVWPRYQSYAHKIVHSDFIQNWSEEISAEIEARIRANESTTFLVHGSRHSQGDAKNNPLLALPFKQREAALRAQVAADAAAAGGGGSDSADAARAELRSRHRAQREGEPRRRKGRGGALRSGALDGQG